MPLVNVFFSDETILNVIRWMVSQPWYKPTAHDSDPPIARWLGTYDLRSRPGEYLNKITIAEVRKLLKYSGFKHTTLKVHGVHGTSWLGLLTNPLSRVFGLQELTHSYFVASCRN